MLHIGCHLSASKGYLAMGKDAQKINANTFQFFTRNPRGGKAKELNEAEKTTQYKVALDECYVNILEIEIADNYTASYKKGKVIVKAKLGEEEVVGAIEVISDVYLYDMENVKWACEAEEILDNTFKGYSDFDETEGEPTVVPKTVFRYIKGKTLAMENGGVKLTLKGINASQPALNIKGFKEIDEKEKTIEFGFYGNEQKAFCDFTIEVDLGMTYCKVHNR